MKSEVKIHTKMEPAAEQARRGGGVRWKRISLAGKGPIARWKASAPGERLLRNTSIACALLLGVMTLRNADLPWTQRAAERIEQAMTMRIDLDESLGRLHFVREWMPEAVLVFWNGGARQNLHAPVTGEIEHEYSAVQPWRMYRCEGAQSVCAALDGEVVFVEQGAMSDWLVLLRHADDTETVYAYLAKTNVQQGDRVIAGDELGATAENAHSRLYFAMQRGGEAADPAEYE